MKKVLVIHTGGTIAMQEDEDGRVHPGTVNPLYSTTDALATIANVTTSDYSNIPSPHITPSFMFKLAKHIKEKVAESSFDGIVITHGTDTLEETAYLLDLLFDWELPIIMTGAMRSSNEISADGPHNLITAVRVAVSENARSQGVLVVFNDEIHTAKHVTKTNTSQLSTFKSLQSGPIGVITKQDIVFYYNVKRDPSYAVNQLTKKVVLLKAYAGMAGEIIDAVHQTGIDGLVLEGFGQGNLPPQLMPKVKQLIAEKIPVVLVSRCPSGIVQPTYSYEGGGRVLKEAGILFTDGLNGQKARLKLMVALEIADNSAELESFFQ